jgi:hypothetical protein
LERHPDQQINPIKDYLVICLVSIGAGGGGAIGLSQQAVKEEIAKTARQGRTKLEKREGFFIITVELDENCVDCKWKSSF